jgi:hypothetical protein
MLYTPIEGMVRAIYSERGFMQTDFDFPTSLVYPPHANQQLTYSPVQKSLDENH